MCGRFAVTTDPAVLAQRIEAIDEATGAGSEDSAPHRPDYQYPNYNVAPTATVATVVTRHARPDDQPTRRLRLMRWGLVPPWADA
ncbi:MAG: SOS response-associated peptidase family protein, partial [Mycobacterium sp.]|nr:SOS response-associated peptidase family protein [Mycobacterium sp.]